LKELQGRMDAEERHKSDMQVCVCVSEREMAFLCKAWIPYTSRELEA
jgi:hypothetical protein